ncbi:MAG: glycosyltransferase family 4 protein [Chloroflexi bacterium]|nr:glycosyltransferase family 4 protein [Chloroflexota bacterium]
MNILFVHEVDWLRKVVFDIHTLSESMSQLGHKIYAIDYANTWTRNGIFDLGSLKTKEFDGISRALGGPTVSLRRPGFIKIPGLSRMSAAATHYLEIRKTIKEKTIDAIILYSVPTNGLQTVRLARKFNIPVLFRSIDILHILVPFPPLRPITKMLEKRVYSQVDLVIPNTPQYAKYVASMGVAESKIKLLPCQIDTGLFRPGVDSSEVRQKWGLKESEPVIVFIGTLFDFSGLDEFVSHFPEVLKETPEAKLLIVGDGVQRPKLERIIKESGLENRVIITGFQPYQTMPQYINLATVCINPFLLTQTTIDIFPAKMMQYVACGKATVATALRGITTLLPGESHGVVYAKTPAEMVPAVIALLKSPERRRRLGEAGLAQVRDKYSVEQIARQLEAILAEAIKEKQSGRNRSIVIPRTGGESI